MTTLTNYKLHGFGRKKTTADLRLKFYSILDKTHGVIAFWTVQKLELLFRARKFFIFINIYTLNISQVRRFLEYCSCILGIAPATSLNLIDSVQRGSFGSSTIQSAKFMSLGHKPCSWRPMLACSLVSRTFL